MGMLDLDALNPEAKIFESREDELTEGFEDAKKWFGLIMTLQEFRSFIWSNKGPLSDNTVLYAIKYDKQRRKCLKNKVERYIKINGDQLAIDLDISFNFVNISKCS